ncbi:hypothetical protein QVD17_20586 [Tagetes erecta]|uniref:Uncharacterized protein n=1 Tax=Tagetes erecta TaxID=13708 RepID=A0AAD8NXD8_TARER|nr:hypothetical protein QVD17_19479 [Tagetes erecta]KAK1425238.1 hypothetical protein QVD17_20586 [Tagetes erecta]
MNHNGKSSTVNVKSKEEAAFSSVNLAMDIFVMYPEYIGIKRSKGIRVDNLLKKKLDWTNRSNNVDCGLSFMRHMGRHMGMKVKNMELWAG